MKLIILLPTDDLQKIIDFSNKTKEDEVIIPDSLKILIKERDGYWREIETSYNLHKDEMEVMK